MVAPQPLPTLLTVCLPPDDELFRLVVESVLEAAGPGVHVVREGLPSLVSALQQQYPDADVEPVILAEPESGRARQIWWYIHRDGLPEQLM